MSGVNQPISLFFKVADYLLLIHFTIDPYIYVLLRTNYWKRFKYFLNERMRRKRNVGENETTAKADRNRVFEMWSFRNDFKMNIEW